MSFGSRVDVGTSGPTAYPSHAPLVQADAHDGHAKLHDFCMTIPYGAIAAVGGVVSLLFGAHNLGPKIATAGVLVCASSFLSLKSWRQGGASTPFTATSAGRVLVDQFMLVWVCTHNAHWIMSQLSSTGPSVHINYTVMPV